VIRVVTIIERHPSLTLPRISDWVARGWVRAEGPSMEEWRFSEDDANRLVLLWDLEVDLAIDIEAIPVVLSLLDQVTSLRATLVAVSAALDPAPAEVRARVAEAIGRLQH
jgi:chaperone modulatory protein CbpM